MKFISSSLVFSAIVSAVLILPAYGLDLNTATYQDLLTLPGINKFQAYKISEYREVFGYYRTIDELLKVEGVTQEDIYNWRKEIVVAMPQAVIKPKAFLKVKEQNTSGVEGGEYRVLHLRVKDLYPRWSGALLIECYRHYLQYTVTGSKAMNGNWSSSPKLNKFYMAWTPNGAIDKLYFGDYLVGFSEGVVLDISGRSKPQGLYPGDEPALEYNTAKISNNSLLNGVSYKSAKSFRGLALALDQTYLKETVFYSNKSNSYYGFYVDGSALRKPLENYFSEQLYGADVTGYVFGETEIGVTSYSSGRAAKGPDPWRYPPGEQDFLVYGSHASTYLGRINLCGEVGKVKDHGQAFFLESSTALANLNFSVSYRKYDLDYYNPHAGSYSRHYPQSVFRDRDEKGVLAKIKWQALSILGVDTFFDQYTHEAQAYWSRSKGDYAISLGKKETDREAGLETKTLGGRTVVLHAGARYKDNNIYRDSGSEKINFSVKVHFTPNEKVETSLKYYARKYLYVVEDYTPYDYIVTGCFYQATKSCAVESSLKYANLLVRQGRSGIGEYGGKIHYRVNEEIRINISYSTMPPLAGNSKYEFEDEADLLPYTDEYYLDKFMAEVVFHW